MILHIGWMEKAQSLPQRARRTQKLQRGLSSCIVCSAWDLTCLSCATAAVLQRKPDQSARGRHTCLTLAFLRSQGLTLQWWTESKQYPSSLASLPTLRGILTLGHCRSAVLIDIYTFVWFVFCLFMCLLLCPHHSPLVKVRVKFVKSSLSSHLWMGSTNQIQIVSLHRNHFYQLNHLASPNLHIFIIMKLFRKIKSQNSCMLSVSKVQNHLSYSWHYPHPVTAISVCTRYRLTVTKTSRSDMLQNLELPEHRHKVTRGKSGIWPWATRGYSKNASTPKPWCKLTFWYKIKWISFINSDHNQDLIDR